MSTGASSYVINSMAKTLSMFNQASAWLRRRSTDRPLTQEVANHGQRLKKNLASN
jgi:hypothetical protein